MTHDAFVSYASEDKSAADTICAGLEARGISCWIAPRDVLPGQDETASILTAIDTSAIVVLCLSSAANASKLVTQQAARAFNKHVPIVPLRIEEVEPSDALTLFLGPQEPFDAFAPPLEAHLGAFAELLGSFLARAAAPATGVPPPSEPPYETVTSAAPKRGGAPPHARRRATAIAALVVVALVLIAALFVLFPQSQLQEIGLFSSPSKQSPTPSGGGSQSAEGSVSQPSVVPPYTPPSPEPTALEFLAVPVQVNEGQSVTVTLRMAGQRGEPVADGLSINMYADGRPDGQAVTSNGGNGFSYTYQQLLSAGTHSLTASFSGNAQYGPTGQTEARLLVVAVSPSPSPTVISPTPFPTPSPT